MSEMNDDEQMLIEEDRARDFKRKVKKLDKEISFYLVIDSNILSKFAYF